MRRRVSSVPCQQFPANVAVTERSINLFFLRGNRRGSSLRGAQPIAPVAG